mmetsp:Transcript_16159/g.48418  ORF Transcript_16159/g.48418 Transcript_16159/m.48418 type:complete len:261 (-) Transcript_16159:526-1308(-)
MVLRGSAAGQGVAEHHNAVAARYAAHCLQERRQLVRLGGHRQEGVAGPRHGAVQGPGLHPPHVGELLRQQLTDSLGDGGSDQHSVSGSLAAPNRLHHLLHLLAETSIKHGVGLIKHQPPHIAEGQVPLGRMAQHAVGRAHQHIQRLRQRLGLQLPPAAATRNVGAKLLVVRKRLGHTQQLHGQLPSGAQDQHPGASRAGRPPRLPLRCLHGRHHGQKVRQCLAGASVRGQEHISTFLNCLKSCDLDLGWLQQVILRHGFL